MLRIALVLLIALAGSATAGEFVPRKPDAPAAADPSKPTAKPSVKAAKRRPPVRTAAKKPAAKAKKKAVSKSDKTERRPLP